MAAPLSVFDHQPVRDRQRHRAARGEDRLGSLPDDMIHLVLRRLDTRSALATATLSRRWARLPRELPVLDFKVRDVLPERYRRYLRRRADVANRCGSSGTSIFKIQKLDLLLGRYERRGMRSLAASLAGFLDADDNIEPHRRVQRVSLEIFPTHHTGSWNRLIATAIGRWGVEDLEVIILNPDERHLLKLSNCAPHAFGLDANLPPSCAFSALAMLVLQDMPMSTPRRVYEGVISACPALEVLHLRSCGCHRRCLVVDAPGSRITELLVELTGDTLGMIDLRALPRLERLTCMGAPLQLKFGSVPRLARLNLAYDEDASTIAPGARSMYTLSKFLDLPSLEDLVIRFTGPQMWVTPSRSAPQLGKLKRLRVADMAPSWDITWTRYLLEAAPFLETLHIHVALIRWSPSSSLEFKHRRLGEVVVWGFKGTWRQVHFVRFLRRACTALRDVVLLRNGRVREKGLLDWETVAAKHEYQWIEVERRSVMRKIEGADAIACCTSRIVLR
ncbi:hypothetical protein VPH35_084381 [Triticum aestivum]